MRRAPTTATLATWFALLPAALAASDYGAMTLFTLLTNAEVTLLGTVRDVAQTHYAFDVSHAFHPADAPDAIDVQRMDIYPQDTRSGDFAEAQALVLFADRTDSGQFRPLGKAAEGEMMRDAEFVYVREMARPPADLVRVRVSGLDYFAYRMDIAIFDRAVDAFYTCYRATLPGRIERICPADTRDDLQNGSWLTTHLFGIAERLIAQGD